MLEPDGRAALTEQLRPPPGYELLQAVGTTFTLDLTSALSIPLSFAGHRVRESDDPIAILDAVRRAADRVDIFAQAGQIAAPRQASDLVAFLELMTHPVMAARRGSLFHPKVWVLEYGFQEQRAYRFLCSSRNLTSDRSWDTVVRLDGVPTSEQREQSAPVRDFVAALPGLAVAPMPEGRAARVAGLADRIGTVEWEHPSDVREIVFHGLGIGRPLTIDFGARRHLIISPFLSDEGIARVAPPRSAVVHVVSRAESFEGLSPKTLKRITGYVLDDAARDTSENADNQGDPGNRNDRNDPLVGLHSKTFVLDRQSGSRVFVGSANATEAAFSGNVEFVVELTGPRPRIGVDAVFGEKTALRQMMIPYQATGGAEKSSDEVADHALEVALRSLAAIRLRNTVTSIEPDLYSINVAALAEGRLDPAFQASVQLLTRPGNSRSLPMAPGDGVDFAGIPLTDITPFLVVRLQDERGEALSTVVRAELIGDLPHRRDAVLARQIDTPEKFLQFLMLMLSLNGAEAARLLGGSGAGGFGDWTADGGGIFESLVRALGAGSAALDDLSRLIDRLRENTAATVLPEGFDELWASVWAAHRSIQKAEA